MWYRKAQEEATQPKTRSFYSHLLRVVENKMVKRMPAHDLARMLSSAGVTAEEMSWADLDKYFQSNPVVVKTDFLNYLRRKIHNIVIHEVDYEAEQSDYAEELGSESHEGYGQYTLSGHAPIYREFLISIGANADDPGFIDYLHKFYKGQKDKDFLKNSVESNPYNWQLLWGRYLRDKGEYFPEYNSTHYKFHENTIAHIRATERKTKDGKRALHLEEVQSDWHQDGRKHGYHTPEEIDVMDQYSKMLNSPDLRRIQATPEYQRSEDDKEFLKNKDRLWHIYTKVKSSNNKSVLPGPYSKTWHEIAMKHALDIAAREGYDHVTWNTGAINRDIFSLTKQVDKLEIGRDHKGLLEIQGWKDGKLTFQKVEVDPASLDAYIGKEAAEKYLNSGQDKLMLETGDLEVGGKGMDGFYDKILPDFMRKYTKRWKGNVQPTELNTDTYNHYVSEIKRKDEPSAWWVTHYGTRDTKVFHTQEKAEQFREERKNQSVTQVHGLEITPEMRKDILTNGQKLAGTKRSLTKKGLVA